jgi:hypothetical protein
MRTKRLLVSLAIVAAALASACSNSSSPTEPQTTASLSGYVRICGYEFGTVTFRDSAGHSAMVTLPADGTFSIGTVLSPGPYDVYLDKAGQPEKTLAMHGQDSSSPILHAGANQFFWQSVGTC